MTETRNHVGEVRSAEVRAPDGTMVPGVDLQVITPGIVDDYGSVWTADVFDESLRTRMPVLCWGHDWSDPLGPALSYELDALSGPRVSFMFSDPEAVPQARRARAQVQDGTIQDCSVGFTVPTGGRRDPTEAEQAAYPGVKEFITRAELDEVSLVLRGAVPGAKVLAVRSAVGTVDVDALIAIAKRKASGELSEAEAQEALALLASKPDTIEEGSGDTLPPEPDLELDEAETMEIPDV